LDPQQARGAFVKRPRRDATLVPEAFSVFLSRQSRRVNDLNQLGFSPELIEFFMGTRAKVDDIVLDKRTYSRRETIYRPTALHHHISSHDEPNLKMTHLRRQ
jgi:hypothetical protein